MPEKIYNYLAQMLLAFTLLYIYTYYAQFLTIWYGNLPDETDRVFGMMYGGYAFVWWTVLALKFVIPFAALCFPATRHSIAAITAVATSIIIGTICERFIWIAGIYGSGSYPVLAAVLVWSIVALVGFFLVRAFMQSRNLIKG